MLAQQTSIKFIELVRVEAIGHTPEFTLRQTERLLEQIANGALSVEFDSKSIETWSYFRGSHIAMFLEQAKIANNLRACYEHLIQQHPDQQFVLVDAYKKLQFLITLLAVSGVDAIDVEKQTVFGHKVGRWTSAQLTVLKLFVDSEKHRLIAAGMAIVEKNPCANSKVLNSQPLAGVMVSGKLQSQVWMNAAMPGGEAQIFAAIHKQVADTELGVKGSLLATKASPVSSGTSSLSKVRPSLTIVPPSTPSVSTPEPSNRALSAFSHSTGMTVPDFASSSYSNATLCQRLHSFCQRHFSRESPAFE
jgi:hypothetical protein